jgi:pimeloyl-ACP methyl ester carboxylesterase/putative sterol carrier protein
MISLQEQRARRVKEAFAELPERYLGLPEDLEATFQIRLGDVGRTWEVIARPDCCEVRPSPTRKPDVVIGSDAATWLALREGRLSGVDAFSQRRLWVRGDLDYALGFEGLFRLPGDRSPLLRIRRVDTERGTLTSLIAGHGPEHVVCLHGLGSNKASFFETVAALAPDYTVHAIDLPGFGSSDKPSRGRYDAPWFADAVLDYLDARGIERAHLIGNSMGGRVALEAAFCAPERVNSLSLLAPALAFRHRQLAPIIRMLRPELAVFPHVLREPLVRAQFRALFADPERLDPAAADVAVEEFVRLYRSRSARVAFFKAARNIYLDEPHGEDGFYARLADLEPPALFIWGDCDTLIPAKFSRHVAKALPDVDQVTLTGCGHVPQVELPDLANRLIRDRINSVRVPSEMPQRGVMKRLRRAV